MFVASTDYMSWMFNGMRQFIAVSITLGAFSYILEKRYVPVIGLILLAATIHGSALLMLPLVFVIQGRAWNRRTLLLIAVVCGAILFMGQVTDVLDHLLAETQYSDIVTNEIWQNDDGTNLLRVLFYSIPALLALWGGTAMWNRRIPPPGERLRELLDLHGDDLSAQRVFFGHLCGSMCAKPLFSKLFQLGNNFGGRWKPR